MGWALGIGVCGCPYELSNIFEVLLPPLPLLLLLLCRLLLQHLMLQPPLLGSAVVLLGHFLGLITLEIKLLLKKCAEGPQYPAGMCERGLGVSTGSVTGTTDHKTAETIKTHKFVIQKQGAAHRLSRQPLRGLLSAQQRPLLRGPRGPLRGPLQSLGGPLRLVRGLLKPLRL